MVTLDIELQNMTTEWQRLKNQYTQTSELWRDSLHKRFEKEHWQPIENEIQHFLNELEMITESVRGICNAFGVWT